MLPRDFASGIRICAIAAAVLVTAASPAATVALGPPPGADLSVEKLSPIEDFINGEIVARMI
jgi:hypothetical protein